MSADDSIIVKRRSLFHKIVNGFLYSLLTVFILLLTFFGFSQTSTFREFLRSEVETILNENINGHFSLEKIDGTVFTSLFLRNIVLSDKIDTIANIKNIEVKISPLQILLKKIHVRNLSITDAKIVLLKDTSGILNISKVFPSSEDEDTTSTQFPFTIRVAELALRNIDFSLQSYSNKLSQNKYEMMNLDDLQVKDLNLNLSAFVSINENQYELNLDELKFQPNFSFIPNFDMSASFNINERVLQVMDLKLSTDETKVSLSASVEGLNIFGDITAEMFKNSQVSANAEIQNFDFDLLTTFLPPLDILKGKVNAILQTDGTFNELNITKLYLEYLDTKLNATGKILNIDNIDEFFIDCKIDNSELNYSNVNRLLPTLDLPVVKGLEKVYFDTLTYYGTPFNFASRYAIRLKEGAINGNVALDYSTALMKYDLNLNSKNIDLRPVFDIPSIVSISANLKGSGLDADRLTAEFDLDASGSSYLNQYFSELKMNGKVENRFFFIETEAVSDSQKINFFANLNFDDSDRPIYRINSSIENFNLAAWINDTSLTTDVNLNLFGMGESFDPDKINSRVEIDVVDSYLFTKPMKDSRIEMVVKTSDEDYKKLDFKSNIIDGTIEGKFRYDTFISVLSEEISRTTESIISKVDSFFPITESDKIQYKANLDLSNLKVTKRKGQKEVEPKFLPVAVKYDFVMKDLSLLTTLIDSSEVDFEGRLFGSIVSGVNGFELGINVKSDFLKFVFQNEPYFISDAQLNFEISHPLDRATFNDIKIEASSKIGRLFVSTEINDIYADVSLSNSVIDINSGVILSKKTKPSLSGSIDLSGDSIQTKISKLFVNYGDFSLLNNLPIMFSYKNESVDIKQFALKRGDSEINLHGKFAFSGNQNLSLSLKNFKGYDLSYSLLGISPEEVIDGDLNLYSTIKGTLQNPEISLSLVGDSISYKKKNFGSLRSNFSYINKMLNSNIQFVERVKNIEEERLLINGAFPLDLAIGNVQNRLLEDKDVRLTIYTDNFNLAAFGDALPFVDKLRGILSTDVRVSGTYSSLKRSGFLRLTEASFLAESNNLEYNTGLVLKVEETSIQIDSFLVKNLGIVKNSGTVTGSGYINFDGLKISDLQIALNGNLTVLSNESKTVSPAVYGNLFVQTDGDIIFSSSLDKSFLRAPIIVKEADLYFPPTQSGYAGNAGNFIYKFVEDTINLTQRELEIQKLLSLTNQAVSVNGKDATSNVNFDYNISVKIQGDSKITFILAKEANNRLIAELSGNLLYESRQGLQNIQGELKLLEGSSLEFFKTFTAAGTLRFESALTNPYLDIISTYKNFLADTATATTGKEQEVAVKIKLKGPLQDLSKSFTQMDNNIAVYYGSQAIENDEPSPQYDKSDAVWFILTGKFKNEVTPNDQSMVSGTATSLAGSILGGVLNAYLGDYVKTLDIRAVGAATKINLSGRFKDFRYTIGGTTNILQDFSSANIRIEYPVIQNFIIRVERKETLTETNLQNTMINELGLRYRFEF